MHSVAKGGLRRSQVGIKKSILFLGKEKEKEKEKVYE